MLLITLLALAALALVLAVVVPRRSPGSSTAASRLRVLLPSWRFFDGLGASIELRMRVGPSPDALGAWRPVIQVPVRTWRSLVWNPEGNLALACHSLVERLQDDLEEAPSVPPSSLVSYQLVLHLVQSAVPADARGSVVQFQLRQPDAPTPEAELLLESAVHPC